MDVAELGYKVNSTEIDRGTRALDKHASSARKTETATERMNRENAQAISQFKKMESAVRAASAALAALGVVKVVADISRAVQSMQSIQRTFAAATGSFAAGAKELTFVREEANRLGLNLETTAKSYGKLAAAAKGTSLEGKAARDVFTAVSEASTALGLSAEQSEGALNALQQMISKGTVQAEELRGQLGERIPGAFQLASRAMGVTTAELGKMLEGGEVLAEDLLPKLAIELSNTFGAQALEGATQLTAQLNRLDTAIFEIMSSADVSVFSDSIADLTKTLSDPQVVKGLASLASGLTNIAGLAIKAASAFASLGTAAGEVTGEFALQAEKGGTLYRMLTLTNPLGLAFAGAQAVMGRETRNAASELQNFSGKVSDIVPTVTSYFDGMKTGEEIIQRHAKATLQASGIMMQYAVVKKKLTAAEIEANEAMEKATALFEKQRTQLERQIALVLSGVAAQEASARAAYEAKGMSVEQAKTLADLAKQYELLTTATKNQISAEEKHEASILSQLPALREQIRLLNSGYSPEQARYMSDLAHATSDAEREQIKLNRQLDLAVEAYKDNQKAIDDLKDQADPYAEAWVSAMERVDAAFANAWEGAFDSFEDFSDALLDSFKKLLAEMAHQAITKPIVIEIQGQLGNSLGSLFGGGSGVSAANNYGGMAGAGTSVLASSGSSAGAASAAGSITSAISTAGVYAAVAAVAWEFGTAIGDAIRKDKRIVSTGYDLGIQSGKLVAEGFEKWKDDGGLGSSSYFKKATKVDYSIIKAMDDAKKSIIQAYSDLGYEVTDGIFEGIDIATKEIGNWKGRLSEEEFAARIQETLKGFMDALANGAGQALGSINASTSNFDNLMEIATSLNSVNEVMRRFGNELLEVSLSGGQAAKGMISMAGGLENLIAITQSAYDFDVAFGLKDGLDPLRAAMEDLGLSIHDVNSAAINGGDSFKLLFGQLTDAEKASLLPFTNQILSFATAADEARKAAEDAANAELELAAKRREAESAALRTFNSAFAADAPVTASSIKQATSLLKEYGISQLELNDAYVAGEYAVSELFDTLSKQEKIALVPFIDSIKELGSSFVAAAEKMQEAKDAIFDSADGFANFAELAVGKYMDVLAEALDRSPTGSNRINSFYRDFIAGIDAVDEALDRLDGFEAVAAIPEMMRVITGAVSASNVKEVGNQFKRQMDLAASSFEKGKITAQEYNTQANYLLRTLNVLPETIGRTADGIVELTGMMINSARVGFTLRANSAALKGVGVAVENISSGFEMATNELSTLADEVRASFDGLSGGDTVRGLFDNIQAVIMAPIEAAEAAMQSASAAQGRLTAMVKADERVRAQYGDNIDTAPWWAQEQLLSEGDSSRISQASKVSRLAWRQARESIEEQTRLQAPVIAAIERLRGIAVADEITAVIDRLPSIVDGFGSLFEGVDQNSDAFVNLASAIATVDPANTQSIYQSFAQLTDLYSDGALTADQYAAAISTVEGLYTGSIKTLEELAKAEAELAAERERIAAERYSLETQLLQLQGDTATLRARELELLDPSNHALQEQIWALEDAQAANDEYIQSLERVADAAGQLRDFAADLTRNAFAENNVSLGFLQRKFMKEFDAIAGGDMSRISDFTGIGNQIAGLASDTSTSRIEYERVIAGLANQANLLAGSIESPEDQTERLVTMPIINNGETQKQTNTELQELRNLVSTLITEQRNSGHAIASNTGQIARQLKNAEGAGSTIRVSVTNDASDPVVTSGASGVGISA